MDEEGTKVQRENVEENYAETYMNSQFVTCTLIFGFRDEHKNLKAEMSPATNVQHVPCIAKSLRLSIRS